jgi:DNA-binding transcriptional MocR family regulator
LSRQHDVGLVEDNPYGELRYSGDPLPHLLELDIQAGCSGTRVTSADGGAGPTENPRFLPRDSNVIYVGTFSKVLMPGLRVGWVIAAEPVIEKMVQAKQAADLHTSTLNQYIALELVRNGVLEQQIPLLRQAYRVRRDAMLVALQKYFPAEVTWTRPDGGMFLMVTLPESLSAAEVLRQAIPHKVAFVPGDDFHLNGMGQNTLRLNFSNARPDLIDEGIKRLGKVLEQLI